MLLAFLWMFHLSASLLKVVHPELHLRPPHVCSDQNLSAPRSASEFSTHLSCRPSWAAEAQPVPVLSAWFSKCSGKSRSSNEPCWTLGSFSMRHTARGYLLFIPGPCVSSTWTLKMQMAKCCQRSGADSLRLAFARWHHKSALHALPIAKGMDSY